MYSSPAMWVDEPMPEEPKKQDKGEGGGLEQTHRAPLPRTFHSAGGEAVERGLHEAVAQGNPSAPIPAEAVAAPALAAAFAFLPCRTAASSEVANASAVGYRSAELFARQRKIIRSSSGVTAGFRCDGAIGSACKI